MTRRCPLLVCLPLALTLVGCAEEDRGGRDVPPTEETTPREVDESGPTTPDEDEDAGATGDQPGATGEGGATTGPFQPSGPRSGTGSRGGDTRAGEQIPGERDAPQGPPPPPDEGD